MTSIRGKTAVVIGASSGVGRATVKALIAEEAHVIAVARGVEELDALRAEVATPVQTLQADATDALGAEHLLREFRPDTQAAFHLLKGSVTMPLSPGSTVVVVSSGAAIDGSPLSGGYAGAKRMQWLLANYAQQLSDKKKLGIRFLAVVPHQLIEGTEIGNGAAAAYGASQGISGAEFMKRFKVPLDADKVGAAIVGALRGDVAQGVTAIEVTGQGVEPLG